METSSQAQGLGVYAVDLETLVAGYCCTSKREAMRIVLLIISLMALIASRGAEPKSLRLDPSGVLCWTNTYYRGTYLVETAGAAIGPWSGYGTVVDTNWSATNVISAAVPLTDTQGYYRVGWARPNAIGDWDYKAYNIGGTLLITGLLSFTSSELITPSALNPVYWVNGVWELNYAGPPTNRLGWLGPQIGTGYFGGTLGEGTSELQPRWPTNVVDDNLQLFGDIWANSYTGTWVHMLVFGPTGGPFVAERIMPTNAGPVIPREGRMTEKVRNKSNWKSVGQ